MSDSAAEKLFPDHAWHDGQVACWLDTNFDDLRVFEVVGDPTTFKEICNSPGAPEIIKLYQPKPGQIVTLTFLDPETNEELMDQDTVVLNMCNPETELREGTRFIMDTTKTTYPGPLSYIAHCIGVSPDILNE